MSGENFTWRFRVRLAVPRVGGLREWGVAEAAFERRLAMQAGFQVAEPHLAGEIRRGRSDLRIRVEMMVTAADVGQAAVIA